MRMTFLGSVAWKALANLPLDSRSTSWRNSVLTLTRCHECVTRRLDRRAAEAMLMTLPRLAKQSLDAIPMILHWSSAGRRVTGMKLGDWVGRADMACAGVCI
jgi:hypothetical protein